MDHLQLPEHNMNEQTVALRKNIKQLSDELVAYKRAESWMEQRLIARTKELFTFFDLMLRAGQVLSNILPAHQEHRWASKAGFGARSRYEASVPFAHVRVP